MTWKVGHYRAERIVPVVLLLGLVLYLASSPSSDASSRIYRPSFLKPSDTTTTTMDPSKTLQVTIHPLKTELESNDAVDVELSIRNTADHPVSILKWNSPFDSRASMMGILTARVTKVSDSSSGNTEAQGEDVDVATPDEVGSILQSPAIKFNRKLPPPKDAFIQIDGAQTVNVHVSVPWPRLSSGSEYAIKAKGRWMAVWNQALEDISSEELDKMTGGTDGEFESEEIFIAKL